MERGVTMLTFLGIRLLVLVGIGFLFFLWIMAFPPKEEKKRVRRPP